MNVLFKIAALLLLMLHMTTVVSGVMESKRCLMYLTGQHNVVPQDETLRNDITHVVLAFMRSDVFAMHETPTEFPLFTTVDKVRQQFDADTKVMVAIGGWGDSKGFEDGARTPESRRRWATNVKAMIDATGADGVDIDWEYPGGNRDDYKQIPNKERVWEIEAFVALLEELRKTIGTDKLLSIAVPALERDLMAFTTKTMLRIVKAVDFINVMTYDMMNRRDTTVQHHSGVQGSKEAMKRYQDRGAPPDMLNFGLGYYVKWFMTKTCDPDNIVGCPTQLLEDPDTGADMGKTGAFSWHDKTPEELVHSFERAKEDGFYDTDNSFGYWDKEEKRWWSFDTPASIKTKVFDILGPMKYGGVFAWGLGEDAPAFKHLNATIESLRQLSNVQNGLAHDNSEL